MNMREQFEAWSASHEYLGGIGLRRCTDGDYSDMDLQHAWETWQAARSTTCPCQGRSECVSCCWPKGELEGKRADVLIVDEFGTAPVGYTAVDMGTAASEGYRDGKSSFVVTLPRGDSLARRMYGPGAGGENPLISRADAVAAIEAAGGSVAP